MNDCTDQPPAYDVATPAKRAHIGLDFDETFSHNEAFWRKFVVDAEKAGYVVWIVTCRHDRDDMKADLFGIREDSFPLGPKTIIERTGLPIWRHKFTSMGPKRLHMEQLGIKIDIWIDDFPDCVENGR